MFHLKQLFIMSKTIDLQIEKSRTLIAGIRKNLNELSSKGFSAAELDKMSLDLDKLKVAHEECEAIRASLSEKVKHVNNIMAQVKDIYADKKKTIKGYYPQEEWLRFGVVDKR